LGREEGLVPSIWNVINVAMPSEILKSCYFEQRNLNFVAVDKKVQFSRWTGEYFLLF
jgi:hypothetical protein